jgi:hypothetical protein
MLFLRLGADGGAACVDGAGTMVGAFATGVERAALLGSGRERTTGSSCASGPGDGSCAALRRALVVVAIETRPSSKPMAAAITIGQPEPRRGARGLGVD